MLRSRAGPDIHVRSLATVLLAHALAFADMRLTLPSPGTGESEARARPLRFGSCKKV